MTNGENNQPLRLIPLGGLGEFGLNALVLEWEGQRLLLDAGVLFPSVDHPGVDSIVPDFHLLAQRPSALKGIILTHGHEDHIGALAFALRAAPAPVYGGPLTLALARRRLRERGMSTADLRPLTPGQPIAIGPFTVHAIRVAHSILDSYALAIQTPAGVVLHSGDFKIDPGAPMQERTDLEALARWGREGVRVLLADSTNVERVGPSGGEDDVVPAFEEAFAQARGRALVSCFATSIPRIQRVADVARSCGRSVGIVGRRMLDNTEIALELGLLRIPREAFLPASKMAAHPPEKTLLFVSGSQGEPLSALSSIARGERRDVAVGPGDLVVLSARVIPGNERFVSRVISDFYRRGCSVLHPGTARVHVSGHACRDDLAELLRLVRPDHLIPIHAEYRMLAQHAELAARAGLSPGQIIVAEDGDVIVIDEAGARKEDTVPAGRVLLDRSGGDGLDDIVMRDRRQLSADGIVVPVVVLDKQTGQPYTSPEIVTRGFVGPNSDEQAALLEEARQLLIAAVEARPVQERGDLNLTRECVRLELRRFLRGRTGRRPIVLPVVMEI